MYSTYPKIKEAAKKYEYNIFEGSQFLSDIHNITYGIYFDMLTNKENSKLETSDIILNLDKKNTYYKKQKQNFIYFYYLHTILKFLYKN